MISNHITDLITANKDNANSVYKNKLASALHEAYAYARMVELQDYPGVHDSQTIEDKLDNVFTGCTCKPGMIDKNCPIHKS